MKHDPQITISRFQSRFSRGSQGTFLPATKSQDWRQIGMQNKCKTFFYIFSFLVYKDICSTIICSLTA